MSYWIIATVCMAAVTGCERRLNLPMAELDPGGATFDLSKISEERFSVKEGVGLSGRGPLMIDWREFRKMNATGISFKCRVRCLDTDKPTSMKQQFGYYRKGRDGKPMPTGQPAWGTWAAGPADGKWHLGYWGNIGARDGTDFVELNVLAARGSYRYEVEYKDVQPVRASQDESLDGAKYPLAARQIGTCGFDSEFHISSGSAQLMVFNWKYNGGHKVGELDRKKLRLRFALPDGIEFVSATCMVTGSLQKAACPDGRTAYEWSARFAPQQDWQSWYRPACLVSTSLAAGSNPGAGTFTVLYEGKAVTRPFDIPFKVVEPMKPQARAKRFISGVQFGGPECQLNDAGLRAWTRSMVDAGVSGYLGGADSGIKAKFQELGVTFNALTTHFIANGYDINTYPPKPDERPQDERFVSDGTPAGKAVEKMGVCPTSIYGRKPYFMKKVMPSFRAFVEGEGCGGSIWLSNWEPNKFFGHGCMCGSCRAEFAAYSGIAESELMKDWPKCVMEGGRFRDKAITFRAKQHAKVVLTLQEEVLKIPGLKEGGFCPEVDWTALAGGHPEEPMYAEASADEYAGKLKWINPWGPYVFWSHSKPHSYRKGKGITTWVVAKAVREHVDRTFQSPPKIMSFPHGYQSKDWVTLPEWLALGMDSFLFNGWDATLIYYFPRGYDSRWWKAFASSAEHAAFYEDYMLDGKRVDDKTVVELVPEFASPVERPTRYLPAATNVSLLCSSSYQLGDSRIVAALNFWEKGEAFFTLKCRGLKKGGYTLVSDRKTIWTREGKSVWSEADLEKGVFAQVGALRTKVFEIRPAAEHAECSAKDRVDGADVMRRYAAVREALKAAAEEDK